MNAHQRKKNAKAFIAELKAYCDDEKVSSLLEAADDLRKLNKENEQLRQRVQELENERLEQQEKLCGCIVNLGQLRADLDKAAQYWQIAEGRCDALKQQRDGLLKACETYMSHGICDVTYYAIRDAIASVKEK